MKHLSWAMTEGWHDAFRIPKEWTVCEGSRAIRITSGFYVSCRLIHLSYATFIPRNSHDRHIIIIFSFPAQ